MATCNYNNPKNELFLKSVFTWPLSGILLSKFEKYGYVFPKQSQYSPIFRMEENEKLAWMFRLKFNYIYSYIRIALRSAEIQPAFVKYKICLLCNGEKIFEGEYQGNISVEEKETEFRKFEGIDHFITAKKFYFLLPESEKRNFRFDKPVCNLYLRCEIQAKHPKSSFERALNVDKPLLLKDVENFLLGEFFFDITFNVKGRKFFAHKAVLSERSPVFSALFQNNLTESKQSHVVIDDIDPEVFKDLLKFIYTGKLVMTKSLAPSMLPVAKKYKLSKLKTVCEECLTERLTVENAVDTLLIADASGSLKFKQATLEFISKAAAFVSKTEEWEEMLSTRPDLTKECFDMVISVKKE